VGAKLRESLKQAMRGERQEARGGRKAQRHRGAKAQSDVK